MGERQWVNAAVESKLVCIKLVIVCVRCVLCTTYTACYDLSRNKCHIIAIFMHLHTDKPFAVIAEYLCFS